jgi:general stress protein 26
MGDNLKDDLKKVDELIQDIRIAMLTTAEPDGTLRSRPMATQPVPFDGEIWFFTDENSGKVFEIERDHHVNVAYSAPDRNRYVSVAGQAFLVTDKAKIHALWSAPLKAWFPDGPDTPGIALLQIKVASIEYWDTPSSTMVHLYGVAKAALTGERADPGEHDTITLK